MCQKTKVANEMMMISYIKFFSHTLMYNCIINIGSLMQILMLYIHVPFAQKETTMMEQFVAMHTTQMTT